VTFLEAAEEVLRETGRPMTAREITDVAAKRGLIKTRGKTPEATMSARLYAAPRDASVKRVFRPGPTRASRGSVRWVYGATAIPI
jgi:hypothetical protein